MMGACRQFLSARLMEIRDRSGGQPFSETNIFFEPMPRDFLKDNAFAAWCFPLQDQKRFNGGLVSNVRDADCKYYTRIRKTYDRKTLYRIGLYAAEFTDQWGEDDFKGFVDQFEQAVAGCRVIPDALNMAVTVRLMDAVRPWDDEEARQRLKRRPHKALVRVEFEGGIYTQHQVPIIQDVDLQPEYE